MDIFKEMKKHGIQQITFNYDETSDTKAITSIHDTTLGPALGGCRMIDYESEEEAIIDSMRLARGMTLKCSASGMSFGGGKTVLIGDPKTDKNELVFRALGKFVEAFDGRYYTGTDMGTDSKDFIWAKEETDYLIGLAEEDGGTGDTGISTSYGVYLGIKASAKEKYGSDSLQGLKIAVQGLGQVGSMLVDRLHDDGAKIVIDNYNQSNTQVLIDKYPDIDVVDYKDIHKVDCQVFSPCARGGIINDQTIEELNCDIIAGAANNQLAEDRHGDMLQEKGILYVPDFVINAGGLIQVATEASGEDTNHDRIMGKVSRIYGILEDIYKIARDQDISTNDAAIKLAEDRIQAIGQMNNRI